MEGAKLGFDDGRVESDGVKLGCNEGSAVEGTGVAALGLVVGAAFALLEPGAAAAARGASGSNRFERVL